ncbi:hypothetical protein [Gimibacter soli]|uniref:Uncharacterized protein n=1 Tax=Gimibacter soli TaxID=3024400 RepID=A0AAE9XMC5_9PROT|nr:hypothetical protein [Gimibacter soli]WCL52886.1 hypothetical protein PH603_10080 [Gimibacter soli]
MAELSGRVVQMLDALTRDHDSLLEREQQLKQQLQKCEHDRLLKAGGIEALKDLLANADLDQAPTASPAIDAATSGVRDHVAALLPCRKSEAATTRDLMERLKVAGIRANPHRIYLYLRDLERAGRACRMIDHPAHRWYSERATNGAAHGVTP